MLSFPLVLQCQDGGANARWPELFGVFPGFPEQY